MTPPLSLLVTLVSDAPHYRIDKEFCGFYHFDAESIAADVQAASTDTAPATLTPLTSVPQDHAAALIPMMFPLPFNHGLPMGQVWSASLGWDGFKEA